MVLQHVPSLAAVASSLTMLLTCRWAQERSVASHTSRPPQDCMEAQCKLTNNCICFCLTSWHHELGCLLWLSLAKCMMLQLLRVACYITSALEAYKLHLCTQDFPYYVQDGISHDNVWSTMPLSTDQLIKVINCMLHGFSRFELSNCIKL